MRVLILCGAFVVSVVAWAYYTVGPEPEQATFSQAEEPASPAAAPLELRVGDEPSARWTSGGESHEASRPVLARGGRFVRRVRARGPRTAMSVRPVSSRRRKVLAEHNTPRAQSRKTAPAAVEQVPVVPPQPEQADLELARELLAEREAETQTAQPAPPAAEKSAKPQAATPQTQEQPMHVLGPGPVEVILSLTDRFRNSVLRGSVFDPTGDPQQVEALSRELAQTIQTLQARQAAPQAEPVPASPVAVTPRQEPGAVPPEEAPPAELPPPPAPPQELSPEHELVVRTLREAARHLEEAANELEWTARYHLADLLRETAAELRHRAREFQPPRD